MGRRPRSGVALSLAAALVSAACASLPSRPAALVSERAHAARTYRAALSVKLRGPEWRARARALVAFERPASLRLEVPGPSGARFVVLATEGRLLAVFPAERAVFRGSATAAEMERLIGVALDPAQLMDLLLGEPPEGARRFRAGWGARLPLRIDVSLADGTRLELGMTDPEADAVLPRVAFLEPDCSGCRGVDAAEARQLWSR